MPHRFRTSDGLERGPGKPFCLMLADGTQVDGVWGGCAQNEKRGWWLGKPGHELAQSPEVSEVAIKGEDDGVLRWGGVPAGVRLFFILGPPKTGKSGRSYRLAKMVTVAATPEQAAFFRNGRFALLGTFGADGGITKVEPPVPSA